jgi:hypothetical protein
MAEKKLTVEIEMTEEEAERYERFMESGPYDRGGLVKRLIFGAIDRHDKFIRENVRPWEGKKDYFWRSSSKNSSLRNLESSTALS